MVLDTDMQIRVAEGPLGPLRTQIYAIPSIFDILSVGFIHRSYPKLAYGSIYMVIAI